MKKIVIILLILSSNIIISQTSDKITYVAYKIDMLFIKDGIEVSRLPYGKDVTITYDKFWKSYILEFHKENSSGFFNLKYVSEIEVDNDIGRVFKMSTGINNDEIVYVTDGIENKGLLLIMVNDFPEKGTAYLEIKDVKKK